MYKGANMTTQIRVDYITRIAIQMTKKQSLQYQSSYWIFLYCNRFQGTPHLMKHHLSCFPRRGGLLERGAY